MPHRVRSATSATFVGLACCTCVASNKTDKVQQITRVDKKSPLLPPEIVSGILKEAWSSDLTTSKRTSLFVSLCLVNHTFLQLFIDVAFTDVHIHTFSFGQHYVRILLNRNKGQFDDNYFLKNASATISRLCRTLTLQIGKDPRRGSAIDSGAAIPAVLYTITRSKPSYVPNLRHIVFDYVDWNLEDIFDERRFVHFPSQVTSLEVRYTFSHQFTELPNRFERRHRHRSIVPQLPNVRILITSGIPPVLISALLRTCPNVEVLHARELPNWHFGHFADKLPESLQDIVLDRIHGSRCCTGKEDDYGLDQNSMGCWFGNNSKKRRIVMRPGPYSRIRLSESFWRVARGLGFQVEIIPY